jgi:large subunit ribosomal protein L2
MRMVNANCRATIGQLGNLEHASVRWGKAGRNRHRGRRPTVRGSAMNPIAHPMGGGEGRRSGGRHPVSPTGKLAKGGKTRKRRNPRNKFIIRRRRNVRNGQLVL